MDFNITRLEQALQQPAESVVNIAVCVVAVGDVKSYRNKANEERRYYTFIVADDSGHARVRSYLMKMQTSFISGCSLLLQGLIRKTGEESFWAVSTTKVIDWAPIIVPETIRADAQKPDSHNKNTVTPLAQALLSNSPSTVVGKIIQKSPLKHRRQGELPTKFVRMIDCGDGPCVKVALFGEDALRDYSPGDVVSVSDAYKWKSSSTLSTKKSSKIEFLPTDTIPVSIDDQPLLTDDPDFQEDTATSKEPEEFTVMGIQSAHAYQCCPNQGCRNKKLEKDTCPSCKRTSLTQIRMYSSATLVLARGNTCTSIKLFQDQLDNIFELPDLTAKDLNYKAVLTKQLPIQAKGFFTDSGLKVSSKKRKASDL